MLNRLSLNYTLLKLLVNLVSLLDLLNVLDLFQPLLQPRVLLEVIIDSLQLPDFAEGRKIRNTWRHVAANVLILLQKHIVYALQGLAHLLIQVIQTHFLRQLHFGHD